MKPIFRFLLAVAIALGLDAWSKFLVEQTLRLYQPQPVLGDLLRLTLGYNTGITFGLFGNSGAAPLIVTGVVVAGMFGWMAWAVYRGEFTGTAVWILGFIFGGAAGNFIDRLLDLRVTDFLDVGVGATRWYTFNLADMFIVFGAITLFLLTLREKEPTPENDGDVNLNDALHNS